MQELVSNLEFSYLVCFIINVFPKSSEKRQGQTKIIAGKAAYEWFEGQNNTDPNSKQRECADNGHHLQPSSEIGSNVECIPPLECKQKLPVKVAHNLCHGYLFYYTSYNVFERIVLGYEMGRKAAYYATFFGFGTHIQLDNDPNGRF